MASPITTSSNPSLTRPGIHTNFADYISDTYKNEYSVMFRREKANYGTEYIVENYMLPNALIKNETDPIQMQSMGQFLTTMFQTQYVSTGFIISREMLIDNQYPATFPQAARAMKDSLANTKNTFAASVFNYGFSSSHPMSDGQPLYSTAHLLVNGTQANTPGVATPLSLTAVQDALIASQQFLSASGILTGSRPKYLYVPPATQMQARIITDSRFRPETANNDINVIFHENMIPGGVQVGHYLNDPRFWALIHDHPVSFIQFQREDLFTDMDTQTLTQNLRVIGMERYAFGCADWRGTYGALGV